MEVGDRLQAEECKRVLGVAVVRSARDGCTRSSSELTNDGWSDATLEVLADRQVSEQLE